jgi:hypothetical protein
VQPLTKYNEFEKKNTLYRRPASCGFMPVEVG